MIALSGFKHRRISFSYVYMYKHRPIGGPAEVAAAAPTALKQSKELIHAIIYFPACVHFNGPAFSFMPFICKKLCFNFYANVY